MNTEDNEIIEQLRSIKKWIFAGAIGFLLIALGVVIFSVSMFQMIANSDSEYSDGIFGHDTSKFSRANISRLIQKGKIDDAFILIFDRLETHPNDPMAHWLKARVHMIKGEWQVALKHVEKAELLAPSWEEEYTGPMRKKIEEAIK